MGIVKQPRAKSPWADSEVGNATFTVGAEAGNARAVAVQLKDANGGNPAKRLVVTAYVSDAATGAGVAAAAPDGGAAVSVGALLAAVVAGKVLKLISSATGAFTVTLTESTAKTFYLCVILPDGTVKVSPAVAFV
jgi:hypothetical protein